MENHDQAYHIWRAAQVRDRILVHIDAHHDMWWIESNNALTIANFICPALREGMIREIFWIVPDRALSEWRARKELLAQLKVLVKDYKATAGTIENRPDRITATLLGRRLTIATLDGLDFSGRNVLLDIDVDYLMIPQVAHFRADIHSPLPWRWPGELRQKIDQARIASDLVTISYSVEGCYTPLAWKFLGEEMQARIAGDRDIGAFDWMREAGEAEAEGDYDHARSAYRSAAHLMPDSAAPEYRLALLAEKTGSKSEASEHMRRALAFDSSYATGFNNLGLQYFWEGRDEDARAEFQRALTLNPFDSYAMVGMARLAWRTRDSKTAIGWANRAIEALPENLDAHRLLGELYAGSHQHDRAISHYERSQQLALHGNKPLSSQILTCTDPGHLIDEQHYTTWSELGYLRARRGEIDAAISCYRIALSREYDSVRDRLRLALLYLRSHRRGEAIGELRSAVRRFPWRVRNRARREWQIARRRIWNPRMWTKGRA